MILGMTGNMTLNWKSCSFRRKRWITRCIWMEREDARRKIAVVCGLYGRFFDI
jgi:hypothetical protein